MADEKTKVVTDATGSDAGPAPVQPEAGGGAPAPKQEQPAPEAVSPDKAPAPEQAAPAQTEKGADAPKEQKAASVSVFNFSEIMAEKKAAEKAAAQQEAKTPDKVAPTSPSKEAGQKREQPKEQEQPPKRRGRPPKEDKAKSAAPAQKEAPGKKDKAAQKPAPTKKGEKAPKAPKPAKGAPEVKAPVQAETPPAPAEAPRPAKDEQIVYLKLSDLHAFKNHPFQVRNDEEMKAMVSSVRDKGVTQPAIVRPREDGGYEIVSGHRRQRASELAGFTDMPCIIRNLTDEQAITQMVEDNTNQRENILPSERAKALKMQLEAIKHQGAKEATSGQLDPKDTGRRSNEIVAERNKMTVKQVQRYIKLNDLVPDLQKMMDAGQIKFTPAVELAYIKPKNQRYIAVAIESQQSAPSLSQAQRMRELDQKGVLNGDVIDGITPPLMRDTGDLRQSLSYPLNWWCGENKVNYDNCYKIFNIDFSHLSRR
jgi:ParB family chromosome partitioning protein